MRIVAIIFGILAAIVELILVIVSIAVPEVSLWGWIVVLTIVTVGLFFSANKVKKQKEARQAAQVARNTPFMEESAISAIAQGELPVVTGTPVRRRRRSSRRTGLSAEPEAALASVSALRRVCR